MRNKSKKSGLWLSRQLAVTVVVIQVVGSVSAATPTRTVSYGNQDPDRQKLHIYKAPQDGLKPLYIWAHPRVRGTQDKPHSYAGINLAHTSDATIGMVDNLNAAGITVISWGSYPFVNNREEFLACIQDSFEMYDWVMENADAYNWDTSKIIIGGNSRGSIISWELAQSGRPGIIGIHFQQGLPDSAWADLNAWNPLSFVHPDSPPIYLAYARKPDVPSEEDTHDAMNGIAVANEYRKHGIPDKAEVAHSLGYKNMVNKIVDFCRQVIAEAGNR